MTAPVATTTANAETGKELNIMGNSTVTKISASEAERTQKEIHALLKQYPELGINQEYVAALPSGIIVRARKSDPITAKAVLNKALNWRDQLLAAYPDLAQRPAQFAMALETPEEYLKDRSGGKQMGKGYADRAGGMR